MKKISTQNVDMLVKYLDNSNLPHGDVKAILQMLSNLEDLETTEASK